MTARTSAQRIDLCDTQLLRQPTSIHKILMMLTRYLRIWMNRISVTAQGTQYEVSRFNGSLQSLKLCVVVQQFCSRTMSRLHVGASAEFDGFNPERFEIVERFLKRLGTK